MNHDCTIDTDLPAPPVRVLDHFTDPELLTTWWSDGAETQPHAGGAYHVWWAAQDWHLRGTYLDVGPNRLVFTWKWDHEDQPEREVDIRISESGAGSHLSLRHEAHDADEQASYRDGWEHFLGRLAQTLQQAS